MLDLNQKIQNIEINISNLDKQSQLVSLTIVIISKTNATECYVCGQKIGNPKKVVEDLKQQISGSIDVKINKLKRNKEDSTLEIKKSLEQLQGSGEEHIKQEEQLKKLLNGSSLLLKQRLPVNFDSLIIIKYMR